MSIETVAEAAKQINIACATTYSEVRANRVISMNPGRVLSERIVSKSIVIISEIVNFATKELEQRVAELEKENTYLRAFAQRAGCPHNNQTEAGVCKSGYPGCACMDDLMAAQIEYEADLANVAVVKFEGEMQGFGG